MTLDKLPCLCSIARIDQSTCECFLAAKDKLYGHHVSLPIGSEVKIEEDGTERGLRSHDSHEHRGAKGVLGLEVGHSTNERNPIHILAIAHELAY